MHRCGARFLGRLLFFTPYLNLLLPKKARFGTAQAIAGGGGGGNDVAPYRTVASWLDARTDVGYR